MNRKIALIAAVSMAIIVAVSAFALTAPKNGGVSTGVIPPNSLCSLQLVQSIPMPNTAGRIDHMDVDIAGQRLFVATLGNDSLGVIDLSSGKLVHSITGLSRPQGVSFIPGLDKIYVSNAGDGTVDVFNGSSYQLIKAILLTSDADNMRYDATSKLVYVGYGDGGIALINATSDNEVGHFDLPGHPESFQLENPGPRIFVNIPSAGSYVAVIDRSTNSTVSQWAVAGGSENFPMALDEGHHRLYVGLRAPAELVVLDTDSGKVITTVSVPQDPDDIFYDSNNGCVYVSSGQGFIAVIKQVGQDHYESLGSIPTSSGSRTSLLVPELNRLYVAVPQSGGGGAEILVYQLPLST